MVTLTGWLNDSTGSFYRDLDIMLPNTNAIGAIMYSPLRNSTFVKQIDQRTLHLFQWYFHDISLLP